MILTRKFIRLFNKYYYEPVFTSKLYHTLNLLGAGFPIFPDGASGNAGLLYTLLKFLFIAKPPKVLELGTGQSSYIFGLFCENNPDSFCLSVEDSPEWFNILAPKLQKTNHKFSHLPLVETIVPYRKKTYYSNFYDLSKLGHKFNLLLLDGPFGGKNRFGIINYLESILDLDNFILILDDTNRKEENYLANIIEDVLLNDYRINISSYSIYAGKYQRIILSPQNHFLKTM